MQLITPELREQLIANGKRRDDDHVPVVKFFNPVGAATWLVTEMDPEDNDYLFGLADLGMGFPELGGISLSELQGYRGPLGLGIERDLYFKARYPISVYARAARMAERIVESGPLLEDAAPARAAQRRTPPARRPTQVRRTRTLSARFPPPGPRLTRPLAPAPGIRATCPPTTTATERPCSSSTRAPAILPAWRCRCSMRAAR